MLHLTDSLKVLLQETAEHLHGHDRRRFMAQTVAELGWGGQRIAERELGWHRDLIRAKSHELRHLNLTQLRQVILTNFGR